ncbi:class F sortase [Rhodococcus antarcticus]|uniref:Class F sortase n=1 Tax=Rhodococcus antarcticus TaxID=2987751 RepID=A0ABY6P1F0_9NOCA|nr:class F sortase [Rhodococcus antarcticus]UZJ25176.1 class F sortase [Rhodococcus antarcticus]
MATVVLALVGVVLVGVGLSSPSAPAVPPAAVLAQGQAGPTPSTGEPGTVAPPSSPVAPPAAGPPAAPPTTGPILAASTPVRLSVPTLGVEEDLLALGLNPDGTVAVPPLSQVRIPSWYDQSPTPGALGPAAIYGHIDSAQYGRGVFYDLGAMRSGDQISITRADKTVAVFTVTAVREYKKQAFPTLEVYGNIDHAGLRLITCGGPFDATTGNYLDNIVVYAQLTSSHPA